VDGRAGDDRLGRADVSVVVDGSVVVRGDGPPTSLAVGSAYAMATSGSMGAPKVALVPRPMLAAAIHRVSRVLHLDGGDRYLHLAAFGFSSSIRQLLVPLANRSAVLLCDDATRTDPDALLAWLHHVQPTVLDLTPTMLDALGDAARALPDSVRTITCASERLDPAVVHALRKERGFRGTIIEAYGTTETSGLVAAAIAASASTGEEAWPLASLDGCRLHVLDRCLHPVAPGMVGELWVSVGHHAAAYLGATATATAFLPDPAGDGERMFRTGDVVRRAGTDSISWLGRADDVVKVRGERVSLLQVAAAAEAHPAVHRAHAILAEGSVGLGVAVERGLGLEVPALQHHLRQAGLGAGLPTRIAVLDALPVNESGKLDRGALRRAITAGGDQRAPVSTPATDTERRLLAIWEDLLPDRQLGTHDDFFDVGGHSLKAAQLTNRIRDAFGRPDVGVVEVFEHPTIRSMALHLDRAEGAS
jgi:acyl-coenzyme A synthetase/AMP-(fatty) acid ligase